MDKTPNKYWTLCIYLALALATLAVFWQVRNHDFISFDDWEYVLENRYVQAGLTRGSITWAFTEDHAGNWHPLSSISHMLDRELYGANPGFHHLTNLLLHLINTLLLFAVLKRMTGTLWRSAFVAAAFALHPLHVESVAWIAERKDVLSALFWMLTMAAYLRYTKRPTTGRYLLTLLAFALGLMAKPMLVTLPFVLLLLDYWPLGRFQLGRDINHESRYRLLWEKVPFFALSAISSIVTFLVQQRGGAVMRVDAIPLTIRIANAFISYLGYVGKMFWPSRLAIFYPHPLDTMSAWHVTAAVLLLLGMSIWIIRLAPKHRYLLVGWLWYLGTLVPVIGLVQVGSQAMADRYTYIPSIGIFIMLAWGATELGTKWRYQKIALRISAAVVLAALFICTRIQLRHWQSNLTLFEHAVDVTENNYIAHNSYGSALIKEGNLEEAAVHFNKSLQSDPGHYLAHSNLGIVSFEQGRFDEAIAHFNEALKIEPDCLEARFNMAQAMFELGNYDQAVTHFRKALHIAPDCLEAHIGLGLIFTHQAKFDEAIAHFNEALRIKPDCLEARFSIGQAMYEQGKYDQAVTHFTEAVHIAPDCLEAHMGLGSVFIRQGKFDDAIAHYTEALRIRPDHAAAHNDLGVAIGQQGNLDQAITHFTKSIQLDPNYPDAHNNLGYALMQQGNLDQAVTHFEKASKLDPNFADAHYNLAQALAEKARNSDAVTHLKETLRINPDWVNPMNNLAWFLAAYKDADFYNPPQAIKLAERACELTEYTWPDSLDTLAVAYAAAGRFPDAIATAEKALQLAQSSGQSRMAEQIQSRLSLYKAGRPYIEQPPK